MISSWVIRRTESSGGVEKPGRENKVTDVGSNYWIIVSTLDDKGYPSVPVWSPDSSFLPGVGGHCHQY